MKKVLMKFVSQCLLLLSLSLFYALRLIFETEACDTVRCFIKLRITNKDIVEVRIRIYIYVYNILFDPKTTISTSLPSVIIHTSDSLRRRRISTLKAALARCHREYPRI